MQNVSSDMIDGNPPKRNWISFWSLLVLQGQNAFNDKMAQFFLIPLGAWLAINGLAAESAGDMQYFLGAIIVLPFILFSPLAGWVSDRCSKTIVIRAAAALQLVVLVWITFCIYQKWLWPSVIGFFILAIQSVVLGPAKRGIIKELVGHQKLGQASGMMEIVVVLAICAGQIVAGFWFSARLVESGDGWYAALFPMLLLTGGSIAALALSFSIIRTPAQSVRKFTPGIAVEHFGQLKELLGTRPLRLAACGVAFFWAYAGYLNLAAINIAQQVTQLTDPDNFARESAVMMSAASLGIMLGGAISSYVCRRNIELGLVPLGGLVMVVGTLGLAIAEQESTWLKAWFVIAGVGGSMLLIPLNAFIQDICEPEKRGKILAGLGLFDCLAGLAAVMIQMWLVKLGVSFAWQFVGLSVVCIVAANYAARLLPQHFIRLLVLGMFKIFYRIKILHAERVPKEGGVLLTPNHVSYIDAFILSAACPRKIRFLMFDEYFKHPWIGPFVRTFDTVPISNTRAKDALRVASKALEEGAVVCIFPEGQLARTGVMNEFKRGFEMIARKANCPVLPAAMDGLWGSIFSFERKKFIYKWPYRIPYGVTVGFGNPVPADEAKAGKIRILVEDLRAEAFTMRESIRRPLSILQRNIRVLHGDTQTYRDATGKLLSLSTDEQSQIVANALQMGEINAIRRQQTVMIEWDTLTHCRDVLTLAFVQFFQLKVVLVESETSSDDIRRLAEKHQVDQYFSGKNLATKWLNERLPGGCYDFSGSPMQEEGVYACLTHSNRVISMSMPHPEARTATNQHQDGFLMGAWGRLLPGFQVEQQSDKILLSGAPFGEETVTIEGVSLNLDAILVPVETPAETSE